MENKLLLPKPYISYSQLSCFLTNPVRYRKEYFENGDRLNTKYLKFGSGIHKMIEDGTYKELLPDLVVYPKNEFEVRCIINGVPTLSYIDSYDDVKNVFRDTKTGKIPWTQAKVQKSEQLLFYATVLKHSTGKMPEYAHLDWIETKETKDEQAGGLQNENHLNVTGRVKSFEREFDEREVDRMQDLIVKVAEEISDAYRAFISEI